MDDIQFFDTILPSAGLRCIALVGENGGWQHRWGKTNAWLAQAVKQIDTAHNRDVYYGCSSYLLQAQDRRKDPVTFKLVIGGRKGTNVQLVRSFIVDLDVGVSEPGKPPKYATQKDAARAIFKFAIDHKLPTPWLVNSGWGVHAYWPMDADMTVEQWKPVAEALKRALRAAGVLFDPSRTADAASVLRPPGTRNHKRQPKTVRMVAMGPIGSFAAMSAALAAFMVAPRPAATAKTKWTNAANSALGGGMGPDPSSALLMADHCGVMALMRDTRGNVDQPTWYYSLGVLAQTDEAPAICHEWSDGHPDYTVDDTNANLARASEHGATTCAKLAEYQPAICAACPHFGKITSPIQLGRPQSVPVEITEQIVDEKGFATERTVKIDMPKHYGSDVRDGRRMLTHTTTVVTGKGDDKKEETKTDVIANTFFWGVTRMWDQQDGSIYEFEMLTREGARRFVVKGSTIGPGGRELSAELARNEISAIPGKAAPLHNYMTYWMHNLSKGSNQVVANQSFGWGPDGVFVLGDAVIKPEGADTRSMMTGFGRDLQDFVIRKGDKETWVRLVDRAYNARGQEAFQFQLICSFATTLLSLMNQVNGVTVYSHTPGSGVGKTTVQQVGLSVWGNHRDMMLSQGKVTVNALWGYLGGYQSLPVVYDELTLAPVADVAELVFSVSSGRAKKRMTASGGLQTNNANWSTILMASGNTLLSEMLAGSRANTEAEVSRLFEFTLEVPKPAHLSVSQAAEIFPQFLDHYGHAGYAFAKAVVKNRAKVVRSLQKTQAELVEKLDLTQVERHWSALFAAAMVALHLCRALKLVAFEVAPFEAWIADRLAENRGQRKAAVVEYSDLISQMVDDLYPDVLVTRGLGDLRSNTPVLIDKLPRGAIAGRRVFPTSTQPVSELIIASTAIQKWCREKAVSPTLLFSEGVKLGWVHPDVKRLCLGRGTTAYQTTSNVWCWRFFPDVMGGVATQPVTQLGIVQGGKP